MSMPLRVNIVVNQRLR